MTDQLRDALRELLDGIHAGRFVPDGPGSQGYCGSLVEAGECALATPAPAQPEAQEDEPVALKDGQVAALVNELRDIAIKFHDAGQLRERIARVIRPLFPKVGAAAPAEGAAK